MTPSQAAQEKPTSPRTDCGEPLTDFVIDVGTCKRPKGHWGIHWFNDKADVEREAAAATPSLDAVAVAERVVATIENALEGQAPEWLEAAFADAIEAERVRAATATPSHSCRQGIEPCAACDAADEAAAATPPDDPNDEATPFGRGYNLGLHHGLSRAAAATPPLDRLADAAEQTIHSGYEIRYWTGDHEFGVVSGLEFMQAVLARLDEGSATPDQDKGEPR